MMQVMQLFAKQKKIYPRRVWGRYRKLKWISMVVLLGIYYLTPWIRFDRGEHVPDQAVLIDMAHSRAYFFGIEIWPQEVYYITGILILAAVALFFVTSLFGRIWCGYACPQTVWSDLFIWVERLVQGDRNARKKLDESPWNLKKLYQKTLTHVIWLIIGVCTGGAWVFYFNDAPTLMDQILHLDVPWTVLGWVVGLTFSTYLMAGFAREQVCTYMCPYARFQSAMFDKDTLVIAYDKERGEPREHYKAGTSMEGRGHCIACDSCVAVCPVGIDIRNGLQMECIACGLCVDACNHVMDKIGLPQGLIRYDAESKQPSSLLRPRTFWYAGLLAAVGALMLYGILTRPTLALTVIHDRNPLFVTLSEGAIRNGYVLSILNKTHVDKRYSLRIEGLPHAALRFEGSQPISPDRLEVLADSAGHFRLFVSAEKQVMPRRGITFVLKEEGSEAMDTKDSIFVGSIFVSATE